MMPRYCQVGVFLENKIADPEQRRQAARHVTEIDKER